MSKPCLRLIVASLGVLALCVGTAWAAGSATGCRNANPPASPDPIPGPFPKNPKDMVQGFDDVTTLPGAGWVMTNHSNPVGTTNWYQGADTVFVAHDGAATSYIAANYNNTSGAGTISNWLLTPELNLNNLQSLSFWTRSAGTFADRLEVRMSTNGASTNIGASESDVGDFTTVLLTINPSLSPSGYPTAWTQYTVNSVSCPGTGRIAFRYYVTDGGSLGANSNYIGIDTFEFIEQAGPIPTVTFWGVILLICAMGGTVFYLLKR